MKTCTRCGQLLPLDGFYFVSRKLGTRRGECKACMAEMKQAQKDPNWKPTCAGCGRERDRVGPGRRLCQSCFDEKYDADAQRGNGSHRLRLKPCSACGAARLRADHIHGGSLCPICRSVPQGRRKRLKQLYNLTPREFVGLLEIQGHRCAICQRKSRSPLHVDHQHGNDRLVRGLVCATCNSLLGMAKDNVRVLELAVAYLNDPPAQKTLLGRVAHPEADRTGFVPLRRVA